MKKNRLFLFIIIMILGTTLYAQDKQQYNVMTFNIRMSGFSERDGIHAWANRKEAVIRMFNDQQPDFFGVQEMLPDQQQYLRRHLRQYAMVGVGRDNGKKEGECMAVFYNTKNYKLKESRTFWLSETPDKVSRGWDGACKRTLTYAQLEDKRNGTVLYFFNTHLDHIGRVARRESVKLICHIIDSIRPDAKVPVILCGDMNSSIEDSIFLPVQDILLSPSREIAPKTDHSETYNAYGKTDKAFANNNDANVIDHFFTSPEVQLLELRTITTDYGVPYISDHYPVSILFTVGNCERQGR